MCRRLVPVLVVLAYAAHNLPDGVRAQAPKDFKWRYDYDMARKEAVDKNLPLLLDFFTVPCPYCVQLEQNTFSDPKVRELMIEKFICLKVDGRSATDLVGKLRITAYPTVVLAGPDGKILTTLEGYKDAPFFRENLQRIIAATTNPDVLVADLKKAEKWLADGKYALAIPALSYIAETAKGRPIEQKAKKLLDDLDGKAQQQLSKARQIQEKNAVEAIQILSETVREFPGLPAAHDAAELLTRIAQSPDIRNQERALRARNLLAHARDHLQKKEYVLCLDRCETLISSFGDLAEGQEANQLAGDIKNNPEIMQAMCDKLSDRLGTWYLALADSYLKKGQRQQAIHCLQRIITAFPGSRYAESAQIRYSQLQGAEPVRVNFKDSPLP